MLEIRCSLLFFSLLVPLVVNDSDMVLSIDYTRLFSVSILLYSGFPVWLKYVPGISFRTDNKPFKVNFSSLIIIWFLKFCQWSLQSVVFLVYCSPDGNARVHPENCTNDEEWKAICLTRWPHYPFPGKVEKLQWGLHMGRLKYLLWILFRSKKQNC